MSSASPRVLLINQFFWPDMAATAQLLADLADDLAVAHHRRDWTGSRSAS